MTKSWFLFCLLKVFGSNASITLTWEEIDNTLPQSWYSDTYGLVGGLWDGQLFAIGGNDDEIQITSASDLLQGTNDWTTKTWNDDSDIGFSISEIYGSTTATQIDELLYIVSPYGIYGTLLIYNMSINSESQIDGSQYSVSTPLTQNQYPFAVNNGTHVFAMGGYDYGGSYSNPTDEMQIYNTLTDTWSMGSDMITARQQPYCGFIESQNAIYCLGGWNDDSPLDSIEKYYIENDTWIEITTASLNTGRHGGGTFVHNNYIFVVSGTTSLSVSGGGDLTSIEVFDASTETMLDSSVEFDGSYPIGDTNVYIVYDKSNKIAYSIGGYYSDGIIRKGSLSIDTQSPSQMPTSYPSIAPTIEDTKGTQTAEPSDTGDGNLGVGNNDEDDDELFVYIIGGLIAIIVLLTMVYVYCRCAANNDEKKQKAKEKEKQQKKKKKNKDTNVVLVQNNTNGGTSIPSTTADVEIQVSSKNTNQTNVNQNLPNDQVNITAMSKQTSQPSVAAGGVGVVNLTATAQPQAQAPAGVVAAPIVPVMPAMGQPIQAMQPMQPISGSLPMGQNGIVGGSLGAGALGGGPLGAGIGVGVGGLDAGANMGLMGGVLPVGDVSQMIQAASVSVDANMAAAAAVLAMDINDMNNMMMQNINEMNNMNLKGHLNVNNGTSAGMVAGMEVEDHAVDDELGEGNPVTEIPTYNTPGKDINDINLDE